MRPDLDAWIGYGKADERLKLAQEAEEASRRVGTSGDFQALVKAIDETVTRHQAEARQSETRDAVAVRKPTGAGKIHLLPDRALLGKPNAVECRAYGSELTRVLSPDDLEVVSGDELCRKCWGVGA